MRIVISALHYEWNSVGECLRRAHDEFGLNGVELSWDSSLDDADRAKEYAKQLRAAREATGLALYAHLWEDLAQLGPEKGSEALLRWLPLCESTGVEGLVIHGGSYPDQKEGIARIRTVFEAVLSHFERARVILNLENHYPYTYRHCQELFSEPWEFQQVLNLNSPSLRFCFDTGHGHMSRNWHALIAELAPWLSHVHLADNHGVDDDHCMFSHGTVPWDAMLGAIRQTGFDGTFCVEFPVREDMEPFRACVSALTIPPALAR